MSFVQSKGRVIAALALTIFAVVGLAPGAHASDVTGKAGVDTSLPATDSAVTVNGREKFSNLKVTVNQTKNLLNQAISVTWTGGTTTKSGPGRFAANYLQLMQCWGDDDGTNANNPGPPPTQCVQGATAAVYGGVSGGLFPSGSFATERILSRNDWANFDQNAGAYDSKTGYVWQPFKSVDGTVVGIDKNADFDPVVVGGQYWLNPYFNVITTNEIAAGRTGQNGTGAELFTVNTGIESSGLGCGQKVQHLPGGGTKTPQCWLVVVPRGTPTDENAGTPFASDADSNGVMTSPLAPTAWKNRIAIPLQFTPVETSCSLSSSQRRINGTEMAEPAVSSWQPKLCGTAGLSPFAYGPVADSIARQQVANPGPGSPGMVIVGRPLDPNAADPQSPLTYAPLTLSGIVIGFNVERNPSAEADADARQLAGIRVATLNLTPRLLAKLLTQSYGAQVAINSTPDYAWVKKNPTDMSTDPDFLQFNPEFKEQRVINTRSFGGLLMPNGNSDIAYTVWHYVLSDPEAKAWLEGTPDPFGMKVNPVYATNAANNSTHNAFGDPIPTTFPKSDPYCYQGPPGGVNGDVVPPVLCGTDWMPYTQSLQEGAKDTRAADDGSKIVANPYAVTPDQYWTRDIPQPIGSRAMLTVTDSATAAQFGLQQARLSRAGDDNEGRTFAAPTAAGLTKAVDAMKPLEDPSVLEPDPTAKADGAYPLAVLSYAAIKPLDLDTAARSDYAAFIDYAAGDGQVAGPEQGQLPEGYAALPAALVTQAKNAAKTVREETAVQDTAADAGPSTNGDTSAATQTTSPASVLNYSAAFTPRALAPSLPRVVAPTHTDAALAARKPTPAVPVAFTRFVIPGLLFIALLSVVGVLELGRHPRRAIRKTVS